MYPKFDLKPVCNSNKGETKIDCCNVLAWVWYFKLLLRLVELSNQNPNS